MKKLLALSMAAMMALGMTSAVYAADDGTTQIDTNKTEDTQNGEVWGSISKDELKQLKVTMPIKIEYVISPGGADGVNKMTVGDYKIAVAKDSEVGVKLESVTLTQAMDSKWTLVPDATTETTDVHTVDISIAGATMKDGEPVAPDTTAFPTGFIVEANKSASLGVKGHGSKANIGQTEASSLAFDVVYTISQVPATTPAP